MHSFRSAGSAARSLTAFAYSGRSDLRVWREATCSNCRPVCGRSVRARR